MKDFLPVVYINKNIHVFVLISILIIKQKAGPTAVDTVALTLESAFSGRPYLVLWLPDRLLKILTKVKQLLSPTHPNKIIRLPIIWANQIFVILKKGSKLLNQKRNKCIPMCHLTMYLHLIFNIYNLLF